MNNNITEDYCSFEVSKLLKEKGFACSTIEQYQYGEDWKEKVTFPKYYAEGCLTCSIPTHALAIKWMRENFNWNIEIGYRNSHKDFNAQIYPIFPNTSVQSAGRFKTHEEAVENALLYILKHFI